MNLLLDHAYNKMERKDIKGVIHELGIGYKEKKALEEAFQIKKFGHVSGQEIHDTLNKLHETRHDHGVSEFHLQQLRKMLGGSFEPPPTQ